MTSKLVLWKKKKINLREKELGQLNLKLYHGKKIEKKMISSLIKVEKRHFDI